VSTDVVAHRWVRIGRGDARNRTGLVDGAYVLRIFGDLITEITVRVDGDEGLLTGYSPLRFHAPARVGDVVEVSARLVHSTRLRRVVEFEARKVVAARYDRGSTASEVLPEPVVVCTATGTSVVPGRRGVRRTIGKGVT
jgi:3-aminobutyryl-CoA ammonia-lyase